MNNAFILSGFYCGGGDIVLHRYPSGKPEDLAKSRPQVVALMKSKAQEKNRAFLHHSISNGGIQEMNLTGGSWSRNAG